MHYTEVVLKDGREFSSPIQKFRPEEGWVTFMNSEERIYLRDIESAVTPGDRVSLHGGIQDVDMLEQAREFGWDGS